MRMSRLMQGIVLAFMVSPVWAGEFYVGAAAGLLGSGTETAEIDYSSGGVSESEEKFDPSSFDIKGGYRFDSGNRFEITSTSISVDYEKNYSSNSYSGLDFDFLWSFGKKDLKPYLGAGLGLYTYDDFKDSSGDELNGLSINLVAGLSYNVTEHFGLDAGLKYRGISWEKIIVTNGWSTSEINFTSNVTLATIGANYFF